MIYLVCYNDSMSENNNKIDFLAIGDIVIDAFIKLQDAKVHCSVDNINCELCVRFGDKVPYESVTVVPGVGNGPNAAVSASRLGLKVGLITNVGDDKHGQDCIDSLKKDNVSTEFVTIEKGKNTNYHYVLWYDVDRTILVKHTAFTYKLPSIPPVSWLYLTSLANDTLPYHMEIIDFVKKHPETKLAFQPGTFQIKLGVNVLKDIYANTEIFFCNLEEAEVISGIKTKDVRELAKGIKNLGPKIISISDGPNGAYLYHNDELWYLPVYPDSGPAIDRTGAGDAFASTFTAGLALGLPILDAFMLGPINSMSVVQGIGAQVGLLTREKIQEYLKKAPVDYKPKKI